MAAVAIYSTDGKVRDRIRARLREASGISVSGVIDTVAALARLVETTHVDAVLADGLPDQQLSDWHGRHPGVPIIVLINEAETEDALAALHLGVAAILPRSAGRAEIAAAIEGATNGLATLPRAVLDTLLDPSSPDAPLDVTMAGTTPALTARELEG